MSRTYIISPGARLEVGPHGRPMESLGAYVPAYARGTRFRRQLVRIGTGADEVDCAANPTDEVCSAFYTPPVTTPTPVTTPAPEPAEIEMPEEIVGKSISTPATQAANAAAAATGAAMSTTTMLMLGAGAIAAIYFFGKKGRKR